jgi:hypothetical protein
MSMNRSRCGDMRDIEDLVGEPGQGSLGECDQPHGHVDADDRHSRVDPVLDDPQVAEAALVYSAWLVHGLGRIAVPAGVWERPGRA